MKKLFKLLSLLRVIRELRGRPHFYGGSGRYRRSRDYYPLHRRHPHPLGFRDALLSHVLRRVLHGRHY